MELITHEEVVNYLKHVYIILETNEYDICNRKLSYEKGSFLTEPYIYYIQLIACKKLRQ